MSFAKHATFPAIIAAIATVAGALDGSTAPQIVAQTSLATLAAALGGAAADWNHRRICNKIGENMPAAINQSIAGAFAACVIAPVAGFFAGQELAAPSEGALVQDVSKIEISEGESAAAMNTAYTFG